jgi:hypothetical protein
MSQIYECCVVNFSWLGSGDEATQRAMHTINTTGTRILRVFMVACANKTAELWDEELRTDPEFLRVVKLGKNLSLKIDSDMVDPLRLTPHLSYSRGT